MLYASDVREPDGFAVDVAVCVEHFAVELDFRVAYLKENHVGTEGEVGVLEVVVLAEGFYLVVGALPFLDGFAGFGDLVVEGGEDFVITRR